jgi:hypothetical protein
VGELRHLERRAFLPGFEFVEAEQAAPKAGQSPVRDRVRAGQESHGQLKRCLRRLRDRTWFRRQGALVQALVPPAGFDLRVVVAGGRVVGAIERVAAAGEWRTNIALGGSRRAATPTPEACVLATYAAAAVAGDLVGVDLLPLANGDYVVLEVNGAVELTTDYSLAGRDVFEEVATNMTAYLPAAPFSAVHLTKLDHRAISADFALDRGNERTNGRICGPFRDGACRTRTATSWGDIDDRGAQALIRSFEASSTSAGSRPVRSVR